jgi:RNA polymerase sigma factor (sigma-70 family)
MSVLVRRAATRSRRRTANAGIGALFDEHAPMVLAICRYLLRDPQAAEDAAQETFLSAHRSLLGGTEPHDPPAWLATIARNECRRAWRKAPPPALEVVATDTLHDPADIAEERADLSAVATAIGRLPERQREALVLREFCGLTYEQVAAAMSVSRPVVDSLLSRARRGLTERVGYIPKAARGALVLPPSFRDELARLIPGLDSADAAATAGVASAGGSATLLGLGSGPVAVKVAATGVAAVALALPVQATMRGAEAPRMAEPPRSAARSPVRKPSADRVSAAVTPAALSTTRATTIRHRARPPAKAGADDSRSSSRSGRRDSSGSGSGSSGPGSGSGSSGSGSSGSGSSSSGSGSGSSGSGDSRSSNSGPGSGSSGPGSGGRGGEATVYPATPTVSNSGPGSSGSRSGSDGSGSGSSGSGTSTSPTDSSSGGSGSSGSGSSGSGSSGSGSGDSPDDD